MPVTRVEPSTKLFDPARTFRYTNADNTDISKRFKAMQAKAKADAKARELAAVDSRQQCLDIEACGPGASHMHMHTWGAIA